MDDRITRAEERLAHLLHAQDELSDVLRVLEARLARLERTVEFLAAREAERLRDEPGQDP